MKKSDFVFLGAIILLIYFLSKALARSDVNAKHLRQLSPSVRYDFENFLNDIIKLGYMPVIRDSKRTYEQQAYYKKKDPRNAAPGHSSHEIGNAIDLDIYKNGIVFSKRTPKQVWLNTGIPLIAQKYKIRWGGNFKGYADNNHFDKLV